MDAGPERRPRVLVVIPAYNEAGTIEQVIRRVQTSLPDFDLLVVNDGSRDATGATLTRLGVTTATHLCNLGYGRAIQTGIKYAMNANYDVLISLDADGQHHPEQVLALYAAGTTSGYDLLIGSRYVERRDYSGSPLGRRLGMRLFSMLVRVTTGRRIYDTTSGLKMIRRAAFEPLTQWHFIDFHAEAIVYLLRLDFRVGEFPITVAERTQGVSMYSLMSHITYPLQTALLVVLGVIQAAMTRGRRTS
jgi:glycosyltransferase involved in cell wall biosynthesis